MFSKPGTATSAVALTSFVLRIEKNPGSLGFSENSFGVTIKKESKLVIKEMRKLAERILRTSLVPRPLLPRGGGGGGGGSGLGTRLPTYQHCGVRCL